jgi:hypothetical protein
MRRRIKITLLALGTVLGYGFAIHSMRYHHHYGYGHGYDGWCDHERWDRGDRAPDKAPSKTEAPPAKPETPAPQ